MSLDNRDDLIRDLYKNVVGEDPYQSGIEEKRYHGDTNTLMNGGKIQINTARRHEISLEQREYNEIITGNRTFYVDKDDNYLVGDVVVFVELNNFKPTGNSSIRNVCFVDKTSTGIQSGYCVIGWR